MRRSSRAVGGLRRSAALAGGGLRRLVGPLIATAAAALTVRAVFGEISEAFARVDRVAKKSDELGIMTERLIGLQFAAEQTGSSTAVLDKSLQKMLATVGESARGMGEGVAAFEALGISADELKRVSPDQLFGQIGDALAKLDNQAAKFDLARKIFGRGGTELINLLALGSKGIDKMRVEIEAAGGSFNRFDAFQIERANDAMNKLKLATKGVFVQLAIKLAPTVENLANNFTGLSTSVVEHLRAATDLTLGFAKAAAFVLDIWDALVITIKGLSIVMLASLGTASVGISLLTRAANQLPGVDIDTTGVDNFTKNIRGAIDDLKEEITISFNAETNVSKVEETFRKINAAFDKLQTAGGGGGAKGFSDADKAAIAFINTLDLQNDAIGKTANQFAIMRLEAAGADAALITLAKNIDQIGINKSRALEFTEALSAMRKKVFDFNRTAAEIQTSRFRGFVTPQQLRILENTTKQFETLQRLTEQKDFAKNLFDATRTPMEQFQSRLEKLIKLRDQMLIGGEAGAEDLFQRGALKAVAELGITAIAPSPQALERGTAAAFSARNQSKRGNVLERLQQQAIDKMEELVKEAKENNRIARSTDKKLEPVGI